MVAKRGLDSICTTDTAQLSKVLRKERSAAQKAAVTFALRGHQVSQTVFHDPSMPYCDSPVLVGLRHRASEHMPGLPSLEVSSHRPCRRCEKCLRFRQMRWRERARFEIASAKRTWFVTLTFSPVHLAGVLAAAAGGSVKQVEASAYKHVQKFFKRLRKNHPLAKFRYLAVYERGSDTGRSHYHVLIHEVGQRPVLKAHLESEWASFVNARLVSVEAGGAAGYVTKYLTKSLDIPPRASNGYGVAKSVARKKRKNASIFSDRVNVTLTPPHLYWVGSDFACIQLKGGKQNGGRFSDECALAARRFHESEAGWCWVTARARKRGWLAKHGPAEKKLISGEYEPSSGC